jgi:hypothetical protein
VSDALPDVGGIIEGVVRHHFLDADQVPHSILHLFHIMRLSQSYTAFSQKQQRCVVNFAQNSARMAVIAGAK